MDHECVCVCVLQISSRVICDRILVLVRDGFLQQVIGPALFQVLTLNTHTHTRTHTHTHSQKSEGAVTVAMAYLTLFLGHVTNMSLMREFLRFLVAGKYDDRSIINVILNSISSSNVNVSTISVYSKHARHIMYLSTLSMHVFFNAEDGLLCTYVSGPYVLPVLNCFVSMLSEIHIVIVQGEFVFVK